MSAKLSLTVSDELAVALDAFAFASDQTVSAAARKILGDYLRKVEVLHPLAPLTAQTDPLARINRRLSR